jgi:hypothetical protein
MLVCVVTSLIRSRRARLPARREFFRNTPYAPGRSSGARQRADCDLRHGSFFNLTGGLIDMSRSSAMDSIAMSLDRQILDVVGQ